MAMPQSSADANDDSDPIKSLLKDGSTQSPNFATANLDWTNETPHLFQRTLEGVRLNHIARQANAHSTPNFDPSKIESLPSMANDDRISEFDTDATQGREAARATSDERVSDEDFRHKTLSAHEPHPLMIGFTGGADTGELSNEIRDMDVVQELGELQNGLSEADKSVFNFNDDPTTSAVVGQRSPGDANGDAPVSPPESDEVSQVPSPLLIEKILQAVKPAEKVWAIITSCGS